MSSLENGSLFIQSTVSFNRVGKSLMVTPRLSRREKSNVVAGNGCSVNGKAEPYKE